MLNKLLTIARNTFIETIRQPIFAIILIIAILLLIFSPSISMYTIDDDNKILKELGLSTLFLSGLFIAIFSSIGAITEELESKTAMTVLTKPVPRPIFILGKFLGISAAVALAHYVCTITMFMVFRHGVMSTASDEIDWTVVIIGFSILVICFLLAAILNYSYDWSFTATSVTLGAVLGSFGISALACIDKNWKFNPAENHFLMFDVYSSILLLFAVITIVSVAIMFSSRFNIVLTLSLCIVVFMLGLISDYVFGRFADVYLWARVARILIPNLQIYWISDAIYEGSQIPLSYIIKTGLYTVCYTSGLLFLASALFQTKQIGR